jgi:hypothetical protein
MRMNGRDSDGEFRRSDDVTTERLGNMIASSNHRIGRGSLIFQTTSLKPRLRQSTPRIIAAHAEPKPQQMDDRALWVWGRLPRLRPTSAQQISLMLRASGSIIPLIDPDCRLLC